MNQISTIHAGSSPNAIEAEQAVIGSILAGKMATEELLGRLGPEHFYEPLHARIFQACIDLAKRSLPTNAQTLRLYFEGDTSLEQVGGSQYLVRLASHAVTVFDPQAYIGFMRDTAQRRGLFAVSQQLMSMATNPLPGQEASTILAEAEAALAALSETGSSLLEGFQPIVRGSSKALRDISIAMENPDYLPGVTTGLKSLDSATRGLQAGELIVCGARPSMGKTSLAGTIAVNVAQTGKAVGFYSLEMSEDKIAVRMMSDLAARAGHKIPYHEALLGRIGRSQKDQLDWAADELDALPIHVDDKPARTPGAIRAGVRQLIRTIREAGQDLGLIVVDHLGLARSDNPKDNRTVELGQITQDLKAIAKDFKVPVLLLAQLSRALETREDKRPQLSDLRSSGEIEENADAVWFLHREEYFAARGLRAVAGDDHKEIAAAEKLERVRGQAEIIIAKNRNGPQATIDLQCNIGCSQFWAGE